MSYATSEKSVKKVLPYLTSLLNLQGDTISWSTSNPNTLGYQLRQALSIAKSDPAKYGDLSKLKDVFRISVRPGTVAAVRHVPLVESETVLSASNFVKSVAVFQIPDVKEVMSVIGALIENPNFEEYHFPDYTEATEDELYRLYKYASKNDLFLVSSSFLIVTKKEPPENIAWRPGPTKQAI